MKRYRSIRLAILMLVTIFGLIFAQGRLAAQDSASPAVSPAEPVGESSTAINAIPVNDPVQSEIGFVLSTNGIVVRGGYPQIKIQGGYQLAEKTCSIGQGIAFQITQSKTLVNQEIWYQIQSLGNIKSRSVDCGMSTTGWVVGQLSDGKKLVEKTSIVPAVLAKISATDTPEQVQKTLRTFADPADGQTMEPPPPKNPNPEEAPKDKGTGTLLLWWNYLAIAFGSILGFVFLDLERDRDANVMNWVSPKNLFRLGLLVIFNVLLLNVACSDFTLLSIGILQSLPSLIRTFWGTFIAGIGLAVVITKAIAFSLSGSE